LSRDKKISNFKQKFIILTKIPSKSLDQKWQKDNKYGIASYPAYWQAARNDSKKEAIKNLLSRQNRPFITFQIIQRDACALSHAVKRVIGHISRNAGGLGNHLINIPQ